MRAGPMTRIVSLAVAGSLASLWLWVNPPGRFGPSCYGYTSYSSVPRPLMDVQVRPDGRFRSVEKTHDVGVAQLRWLIDAKPEILIVSIGWNRVVKVRPEVRALPETEVHVLPTGEALELFNRMKQAGRAVAIHVHSTC